MKTKKILCLLMAFAVAPSLLFSCSSSNDGGFSGDIENTEKAGDAEATTENPLYIDDLPEKNYDKAKFKMMTFNDYDLTHFDLVIEEQIGEIVNDSIYLANRLVQDRFNIEFEQTYADSCWNMQNNLKKIVVSGTESCDAVLLLDRYAMNLAMEGKYFYTMKELPYVNLEKHYWDQQLQKDLTVGNVLYFTYGANMLSSYDLICFLVFNKQLVIDLGLENIYELVRNGKWTIDKMYEMAAQATLDLDGDGKMTKDDRYGVLCSPNYYYPGFWAAERIPLIGKDADDMPFFNVPGNEKLFTLFDKLYDYANSGSEYIPDWSMISCLPLFTRGQGLISNATMYAVQSLRDMEIDYGIIPYPSLYEKNPGEPYSTRLCLGIPLVVPVTADPERASVILEALASEYQKRVIPAYYDVAVQTKSTRDEESIEVLDMLLANRFIDLGDTVWMDSARSQYEGLFQNKNNTFQSVTEKIEAKVAKTLEKAIEAFQTANSGG
ncbi:MAG: hypothetical protein FWG34_05585 [Oscillospiraceae bacterium]|nr:hypothetical protein [Oscillospiraceae bacterium]